MAIEIPPLVADRAAHPEWSAPPAASRYAVPAAQLLAALESTDAPAPVLDGLRRLAAGAASIDVYLAPDRGLVQVLVAGRRIPLTGAARDAVLVALGRDQRPPDPGTGAGAARLAQGLDAFTAARIASIGAQVQESRSAVLGMGAGGALALPGASAGAASPPMPQVDPEEFSGTPAGAVRAGPVPMGAPLLRDPAIDDAGKRLEQAVGASGLFLEAHLAQWLRGERSLQQIRDEIHQLPLDAADTGPATPGGPSDRRGNSQLEALQSQAMRLAGLAWPGQPIDIEIAREHEQHGNAAGQSRELFQATLRLELPHLGTIEARIRVIDSTVGVQIASPAPARLAAQLPMLADALTARGLSLAQISSGPDGGGA